MRENHSANKFHVRQNLKTDVTFSLQNKKDSRTAGTGQKSHRTQWWEWRVEVEQQQQHLRSIDEVTAKVSGSPCNANTLSVIDTCGRTQGWTRLGSKALPYIPWCRETEEAGPPNSHTHKPFFAKSSLQLWVVKAEGHTSHIMSSHPGTYYKFQV